MSRNSLTRMSGKSAERTWAPEATTTNDYSSTALVKELQTIDDEIKKDFQNLEGRVVRNLKRNLNEDEREVRYHRIWFRPQVFVSKDRENVISCKNILILIALAKEFEQPFVIGYFKQELDYERTEEEK